MEGTWTTVILGGDKNQSTLTWQSTSEGSRMSQWFWNRMEVILLEGDDGDGDDRDDNSDDDDDDVMMMMMMMMMVMMTMQWWCY